jgi:hypothetical protein
MASFPDDMQARAVGEEYASFRTIVVDGVLQ